MVRVDGRPLHIAGQPSSDLPEHRNTPVTIEFQTKQPMAASDMDTDDGLFVASGTRILPVTNLHRTSCISISAVLWMWCNYGRRLLGALQRQARWDETWSQSIVLDY
jgi:hypothetical protein